MQEHGQLVIDANRLAVQSLLQLLANLSDEEKLPRIAEKYFNSGSCFDKSEMKLNRMKFGMFSHQDLLFLLLEFKSEISAEFRVNGLVIKNVLDRLVKFGLVTIGEIPGNFEYKVPQNLMHFFNELGLAQNIVFGIPFMIERLSAGVPAINVENSNGDVECGSGMILRSHAHETESWLITNKHVIFGKTIVDIVANEHKFGVVDGPFFHEEVDLAAFRVRVGDTTPVIPIGDDPEVLAPVIAMGYPRVPTAAGQFMMAHRGEVNGRVETIGGEQFLAISCQVGPGNSGGPIVTEAGFCAGIVTQSGIAEFGHLNDPTGVHRTTYHMAIPPSVVS